MRRTHYLPGNKSNEMPQNCIFFDTETKWEIKEDGYEHHKLWFGYGCFTRKKSSDVWTKPEYQMFKSIEEYWEWIFNKARVQTRLYMFAHNGAFDLPVLNAFEVLPQNGYKLKSAVADAPPLILTWRKDKHTIKFVDTLNIWRMSLEKIGDQLGYPKLTMPKSKRLTQEWKQYCKQDVEILRQAVLNWFKFLIDYDLGGFAPTLASQSFNAYRHRFMDTPILIDNNTKALELSRNAYVGGRTECFKIGKFKGDFYHVDINSMYPFVMRDNEYPVKLVSVYKRVSQKELTKWCKEFVCIADVLLETDDNCYPVIEDNRLIFPVGKIRCYLSTPELVHAIEHGHLRKINKVAVYEKAIIFNRFITELYDQRLRAKKENREVDVWLLKIFMNSLYGKFGQRGRHYDIIDHVDDLDIDVWVDVDIDTKEVKHFRKFGGILQLFKDEGESRHSMPAIASHVTAYSRLLLHNLIQTAGKNNTYYVDTDCLVLNKIGYDKVQSYMDEKQLGGLKLEQHFKLMEIHSPKDYKFGDNVKIKGIRKNAIKKTDTLFEQVKFVSLKGMLNRGQLTAPMTTIITKQLKREYLKGVVHSNGNVSPFSLSHW